MCTDTFKKFDFDHSGSFERTEFIEILMNCGMQKAECEHLFAAADKNGDGSLDFKEFLSWLEKGGATRTKQITNTIAAAGGIVEQKAVSSAMFRAKQ